MQRQWKYDYFIRFRLMSFIGLPPVLFVTSDVRTEEKQIFFRIFFKKVNKIREMKNTE